MLCLLRNLHFGVLALALDCGNWFIHTCFLLLHTGVFGQVDCFAFKRVAGEGLDWSLVDLDGQVQLSTEEDKTACWLQFRLYNSSVRRNLPFATLVLLHFQVKTINSIGSTFSPGKLRWNPYSATLYKARNDMLCSIFSIALSVDLSDAVLMSGCFHTEQWNELASSTGHVSQLD